MAVGFGRRLGDVRAVGLGREDHPVDELLAPDEQAAQQADLPGDQVGRAQARRVEPEDRGPAVRARADDESARVGDLDGQLVGAAADVGRDERGEPRRRIQVDRVERATDPEPDRGRPAVIDDGQAGGRAAARRSPRNANSVPVGVDEVATRPDLPDEDRVALAHVDDQGVGQAHGHGGIRDGRQRRDRVGERPRPEREQVLALRGIQGRLDVPARGDVGTLQLQLRVGEGGTSCATP